MAETFNTQSDLFFFFSLIQATADLIYLGDVFS